MNLKLHLLLPGLLGLLTLHGCGTQETHGRANQSASKQFSVLAVTDSNITTIKPGLWSSGCVDSILGGSTRIWLDFNSSSYAKSEEYFDFSDCRGLRERYPSNGGFSDRASYKILGKYPNIPDSWIVEWHKSSDDPNNPRPSFGIIVKSGEEWEIAQIRSFDADLPGKTGLLKFKLIAQ